MAKSEMWSILTEPEAKRMMTRVKHGHSGDPLICHFCEELIQIGECFIRKRKSGKVKTSVVRYYHERCWKSLLH